MTLEELKAGKVILIDKPLNWTSFQVVNKIRWCIRKANKIKKIKVGHAGTLDPLASGLLIVCTGGKTKNIESYQCQEKQYTGVITLGATTPSYDLETNVDKEYPIDHITESSIDENAKNFIGETYQKAPIFSALKKDGQRLYNLARKGEVTEIKARKIYISSFEIIKISMPDIHFSVRSSKGTYIRSLAYDFGKALKSGGHLTQLRRTKIGDFNVENAIKIEEFTSMIS